MRIAMIISDMIIPLMFVLIISYGISKKTDIYSAFTEGAEEGFRIVVGILPTLIGLMTAVGILRESGALELVENCAKPVAQKIGFPAEVIPLSILRLVSSSASTGLLLDIFKTYGTDSFIGRFVSVMMYCTESVIYVMSVYFMSVKIKKTRYTLLGGLVANVAGIIASFWICRVLWG
jgi:spore maturation protein B